MKEVRQTQQKNTNLAFAHTASIYPAEFVHVAATVPVSTLSSTKINLLPVLLITGNATTSPHDLFRSAK